MICNHWSYLESYIDFNYNFTDYNYKLEILDTLFHFFYKQL